VTQPAVDSTSRVRFENSIPILNVRDLAASIAFYERVLGFTLDWHAGDSAQVSRDRGGVMLIEGAQGHPGTWVWMGVGDAAALHEEYRAAGATIRMPPTNFAWAHEFHVFDPDGHVLRLGSEPLEGVPFGPWLGSDGTRWMPKPDGGWERA
jgi:predicted enzyme related to lactoylglutathione lyase